MKPLPLIALLLAASAGHAASLCQTGQRQSPIAIDSAKVAQPSLAPMQVHYQAAPLVLANDGHTLRVRFHKAGAITLGQESFTLEQFHFHTPGGDEIDGERFPMAAHILNRDRQHHLLAIVVPFRVGAESPVLKTLLPLIPPRVDGNHTHPDVHIDAAQLLPPSRGYYRYSGSLTDAPCTENVEWLVMKQPLELSSAQLADWQRHFADNMRGPNPLHGRVIRQSR